MDLDLFILAATALRFETGIMVHKGDTDNYEFKRKALRVFGRALKSKLLIAVDASKFFEPIDKHRGVVSPDEWAEIILTAASRIVIVTSPPAPDFDPIQRATIAEGIEKFRRAGIQVDDSSSTV